MHSKERKNAFYGDCTIVRKNAIYSLPAGSDLIETVEKQIRTGFACTNLFFSVKYKPLSAGSSETESELWLGFYTANQNTCVRTEWIPTNVGQWLNRSLVRIELLFLLCIFYLAVFWMVEIGGFSVPE